MCEENKNSRDESQISAINAWHSSGKSFSQIDEEYNFAVGTLFTIVNAIPTIAAHGQASANGCAARREH